MGTHCVLDTEDNVVRSTQKPIVQWGRQKIYSKSQENTHKPIWIKKIWHIYIVGYYSAIKREWNCATCRDMEGPRDYYTEWIKSEKQILAYIYRIRKILWMNLFAKAEIETQTHREQTYGHKGGRGGPGMNWETWTDVYRHRLLTLCLK